MPIRRAVGGAAILGILAPGLSGPAHAYRVEFGDSGDWVLDWRNRLSYGMAWRVEEPAASNIAKAQLDPQLCAADDCIALTEDNTEPNERFLAAPGAMQSFTDDPELNYARGDVVFAASKWTTRLSVGTKDFGFDLGALFFYDPVNEDFVETSLNQITEVGPGPGRVVRSDRPTPAVKEIGLGAQLLDANVHFTIPSWTDAPIEARIGRQVLFWGNAALTVQGSVNVINPPDANNLSRPGFAFDEVYRPVGMAVFDIPLAEGIGAEAFYQFEWRPYGFPAKGGFISFFDGGNEPHRNEGIPVLFGKNPSDPLRQQRFASDSARLVTESSLTILRGPNREPSDGGQFGLSINTLWERDDAAPLVLSFFFANYHSRLPAVSATAAAASCSRREGSATGQDATDAASFFAACELDENNALGVTAATGLPAVIPAGSGRITARDALPIDSATYFLDYAEDIRMYGVGFNAELNGRAVQGELAYRPNHPVQVDIEDVLFAALQPVFPRSDGSDENVIDLGSAQLANSRRAIPDFVTAYRGGIPGETEPFSYVRGYERMAVWHPSLSVTKIAGRSNRLSLGADEAVYLLEINADYLPDLPELSELQFQGPGTDTHYSDGIAETGDGLKINPVATKTGFVTKLSWGYRFAVFTRYLNVWADGLHVRPALVMSHDVKGVGPGLAENFVEGRVLFVPQLEVQYRGMKAAITYLGFTGGGRNHTLRDRDALALSVSYDF